MFRKQHNYILEIWAQHDQGENACLRCRLLRLGLDANPGLATRPHRRSGRLSKQDTNKHRIEEFKKATKYALHV